MMETVWVSSDIIERRIDAEFYKNEFVVLAERLNSSGHTKALADIWTEQNRIYIGIAGFDSVDDPHAYTPYLRPTDISDEGHIDYGRLPWCRRHWLDDHGKNGCAKSGDLIVEVKGNTRKVAVISERIPKNCVVSGSSYRIRIRDDVDAHFIQAYLLSPTGQSLKKRLCSNTTISYIDPESFRNLRVPQPAAKTQQAIGNKVRKAERLRELAEDAQASFMNWLSAATKTERLSVGELPFLEHVPSDTCSDKAWITDFDPADRVDPWPHHVVPRTIRGHLRQFARTRCFKEVFEVTTDARPRISPPLAPNCYHLSILDIDAAGRIDWDHAAKTRYDSLGVTIRAGDILYSTLNPQETRIGYVPAGITGTIAASPEFSTLRLRQEFEDSPYLATAVLRSNWVRVQASFLTRSSSLSRRRLAEDDLAKILLPWNQEGSSELEKKLQFAADASVQASSLVDQAKADVEALVSNTLDLDSLHEGSAAIESWLAANPSPSNAGR